MKALVTGANGLIGTNVVRALLGAGHQVRALTRVGSDRSPVDELPVEPVTGDVLDADEVQVAAAGVDVVFHTAVPFAYAGQADDDVDRVAVEGTENVLAAAVAHRVRRVVITSSSVVFGYSTTPATIDESRLPADGAGEPGYVRAKLRQDRAALRLAQDRGLDVVLACPTMAVGPGGTRLGPSNAMVVQYLADPFAMTYQGGVNVVAAEDVGLGHLRLALGGRPGERYLLGGDNLSWSRIHTIIAELTGRPAPRAMAAPPTTYMAAWAEEGLSRLRGRAPLATREQASMTGRYYWYSSDKAAGLGYRARPATRALAEAVSWLATTSHISREMRTTMTLNHDVYEARRAMAATRNGQEDR